MKVAVVGGRGFLGRSIVQELLRNRSFEVHSWDLPETDVRDPVSIAKSLETFLPDIVVNLAAVLGGISSQNTKEIFQTNLVGNLQLLDECRMRGIRHFVFASSLTVHGSNAAECPHTLASPFQPIHGYGASKAASEFVIREYTRTFGMTAVTLRPTMVLGNTKTLSAPIEFVHSLLRGEDIVIYGDGLHERQWLWVDDAAKGFSRAVEFSVGAAPGYYPFFLAGNRISLRDLASRCTDRLGGSLRSVGTNAKAFTLTCDTAASDALLGWEATTGLEEIIERLIEIQTSTFRE